MEKSICENAFKAWINSIPVGEYKEIRKKVIVNCKITRQVFNHWMLGNSKIPPLSQFVINQIAGKEIFDIQFDEDVLLK